MFYGIFRRDEHLYSRGVQGTLAYGLREPGHPEVIAALGNTGVDLIFLSQDRKREIPYEEIRDIELLTSDELEKSGEIPLSAFVISAPSGIRGILADRYRNAHRLGTGGFLLIRREGDPVAIAVTEQNRWYAEKVCEEYRKRPDGAAKES